MERGEGRIQGVLPKGTVLARRYVLGAVLGQGELGVTYDAYDRTVDRGVAVREFFPARLAVRADAERTVSPANESCGTRFLRGADAFYTQAKAVCSIVGTSGVVCVRDAFFENGTAYYVMDRLEGAPLSQYLRLCGRTLTAGEVVDVAKVLADGLLVLHSLGMNHSGICADSIFISAGGEDDGAPRLIDLGRARHIIRGEETPPDFDEPWRDIRALGETLYEAYTGQRAPFMQLVTESSLYHLPEQMRGMFLQMLSGEPSVRYPSVFGLEHTLNCIDIPRERPLADGRLLAAYETRMRELALDRKRARTRRIVRFSLCTAAALMLLALAAAVLPGVL